MLRRLLLGFLTLLIASACLGMDKSDATIEIPFSFEKGYIVVKGKIKKDTPVEMVVATGSEHSRIDIGLLDKYKLPAYYSAEGPVTGFNDKTFSFSAVPDVTLGEAKSRSLNMRLDSMADVSKALGREIFGVLGVDFFEGSAIQLDFARKLIRFLSKSDAESLTNITGDAAVLRFIPADDPYKNLPVPVVEAIVEGKKVKTLVDSGAIVVVAVSPSTAQKAGLSSSAGNRVTIHSIQLGKLEVSDVPSLIAGKDAAANRYLKGYPAVIGVGVLQNYLVTFDFRQKLLLIN